jgi:hypothetical protein
LSVPMLKGEKGGSRFSAVSVFRQFRARRI